MHACNPSTTEIKDRPIPSVLTNECPVSEGRCLLVHIYTNVQIHKEEEEKTPTTQSSLEFCSFPAPKLFSQFVTSCKDRRGSRRKGGGGKGRGRGRRWRRGEGLRVKLNKVISLRPETPGWSGTVYPWERQTHKLFGSWSSGGQGGEGMSLCLQGGMWRRF